MDLIGALSHPSPQVKRLLDLADTRPTALSSRAATSPSQTRTAKQLTEPEVDRLVIAYQAGATVYQLATQLYRQHWSLAKIADKYQVATETIRTQMRKPWERS